MGCVRLLDSKVIRQSWSIELDVSIADEVLHFSYHRWARRFSPVRVTKQFQVGDGVNRSMSSKRKSVIAFGGTVCVCTGWIV